MSGYLHLLISTQARKNAFNHITNMKQQSENPQQEEEEEEEKEQKTAVSKCSLEVCNEAFA